MRHQEAQRGLYTKKDFISAIKKGIEKTAGRYRTDRVFSDFIEMSAIALSNAVDPTRREKREARYLAIVGAYESREVNELCRLLALLVAALEAGPADILGEVFGALELSNKHAGQYFTPFEVCRLMARLTMGDCEAMREKIAREGVIRLMEPAAGSGAMILAIAEAMADAGFNYQQHLHVTAVDVDERAAYMAYVQASLLHIPATIVVGNSLSMEVRDVWHTPAHCMKFSGSRALMGLIGANHEVHKTTV